MMELDLDIQHHLPTEGNPVYIKQMRVLEKYCAETHKHTYDHWALLGSGVASLELDGVCTVHTGPCVIEIKAGKAHKITAITEISWFCIHASTETDIEKIDDVLIQGN